MTIMSYCFVPCHPGGKIHRGFTLIELLIVVAIIAILAAIAVPNFLEAQTRAKVSRVKADMRTVATALESYRVDDNKYPPDFQDNQPTYGGQVPTSVRNYAYYINRFIVLTTPTAYLSSIPEDTFARTAVYRNPQLGEYYKTGPGGELASVCAFDYAYRMTPDGRDENIVIPLTPPLWTERISRSAGVLWALRSVGPDLNATTLGHDSPNATSYDPTNGTVSAGDVFFLGPGIGPESGSTR
ncbi:MAG: prepilin-type N-terminal cleavage/methylation domain-containing protein [Candidatus Sumerlaeaceae bacterium]